MASVCSVSRFAFVFLLASVGSPLLADDWPQWRGPHRDGIWRETGVRSEFAAGNAPVRFRVPTALGYAGPAVADGKVFLFEYELNSGKLENQPGRRAKLEGMERLRCLNAQTGEQLWKYEYPRKYDISYPSGPRCTPTVDGERVYVLGAEGDLSCVRTSDGSKIWSKLFSKDFGSKTPIWGHSAHPLVDGDTLYCVVGGEGSIAVAFDKMTGKEKWRALSAREPGYCPPTMMKIGGKKQLLVFYPAAVAGLDPASGEELWSVPIEPAFGMSIAQPLLLGDRMFVSGYKASVCFELPNSPSPDVLWAGTPKTSVSSSNVTPIFDGTAIYGVDADASALVAVDPATGKRLWQTKAPTVGEGNRGRHGTAFIIRHGSTDRYWLFGETGDLILAKLTPQAYEELGRQHILDMTSGAFGRSVVWSHPAFADRAMFARNDKELVCVDLSGN